SVADFGELAPFLRQSHVRYPRQALVVSEFGAEALYDGPVSVKGTFEFQSDYLRRTSAALAGLPFMNGSIYWALRDFAVSPGWKGGAALPVGYPTDGINHKGLIAYDGTEKPAFAVAASLFEQIPAFARTVAPERAATGEQVSCSFAVDYKSLGQLRRDAASVAIVEPTGAVTRRRVAGLPVKDATVRMIELVRGKRLPSKFTVVGVADARVEGSGNCSPTISKGNAYLL